MPKPDKTTKLSPAQQDPYITSSLSKVKLSRRIFIELTIHLANPLITRLIKEEKLAFYDAIRLSMHFSLLLYKDFYMNIFLNNKINWMFFYYLTEWGGSSNFM